MGTRPIVFEGQSYKFPADATDQEISAALSKHATTAPTFAPGSMAPGSYQTRPGGPILNTGESPFRTGVLATERGLGVNNPTSLMDAITQSLKSFGGFVGKSAKEPFEGGPLGQSGPEMLAKGALAIPNVIARGAEGIAGGLESSISDITQGWNRHDPRSVAAGIGEFIPAKAATVGEGSPRGTMQEIMGEGKSKARLLADQHAHALATKQHLSGVADAVHTDAQSAMSQVLQKVDEAHPEGAFAKADIQAKVSDAVGDLVKVPEKMPASVTKILKEEKPTWEGMASQRDVSGFVDRLRSSGLSDPELRETLRQQGFGEREIANMMKGDTVGGADTLTAEQLKQMRSDVGQELARYGKKGTVGAALNKVYSTLSQELRGAAREAGVEQDWLRANNKYSQFSTDFLRGPLSRVLKGETASSIMEPLTGTTRQQLIDTLQKYRDAGFNIDMDRMQEEMRRYGMSRTVNRLSQPTKMDLLMAGFAPKAVALRQLGPRMLRSPRALSTLAGKGFDTPVSPRQVYPTKAAALQATRASSAAPSGTPALDAVVNKLQLDVAEMERQRAATTDPAKRAEIEDAIWERLNARKRNVGPPKGTPERRR